MMQPVDIKTQSFKKSLFGYKSTDVDQYVDTVYRAYDELYTECKKLREENDRLNQFIADDRVKIFKLEAGVKPSASNDSDAEERAAKIVSDAEKAAADIIEKARTQASSAPAGDAFTSTPVAEEVKEEKKEESAASKFFNKQAEEESTPVYGADDDDVFVGEIEDNRKSNKVMIGDGEDEGADDFEFL